MAADHRLKIFPLAQSDMDAIFAYVSENLKNPTAAIGLIEDFEKAFAAVRAFPESCPLVNNEYVADKTLRKLIVNNYIAFFRVRGDEIQVVRVLYGMSDYRSLL